MSSRKERAEDDELTQRLRMGEDVVSTAHGVRRWNDLGSRAEYDFASSILELLGVEFRLRVPAMPTEEKRGSEVAA